ncbi:vitamin K epoxide reductase family protein [Dysgonomonas sp. 37-18]|nr:vitamin K epoxide reductase family protein [Dysgonomonas sp. 37-18]OJX62666.1 MAG: hypothetical protein BGO84_04005 [Dysgonomonas sp. 37-18]
MNNTFTTLLGLLNVKHTHSYSSRLYNEHPHKYNLYGLSKMLSDYNIENIGIKVNNKEEDIFNLEVPFIAHVGSGFAIVEEIANSNVIYLWNSKKVKISIDRFVNMWSGATLILEANKSSIEPNYYKHIKEELVINTQKFLLLLFSIILVFIGFIQNQIYQSVYLIIILCLNLIGAYVGYLLVLKRIKTHSNQADKICSLFSQNDCNDVLESPAAKFMNIIGWSELGLSYFLSNTFIILCTPKLLPYFIVINICVLPYSFWSIWYQKFKAKSWCPLCLIVQILFWSLFVVSLIFNLIQIPDFYAVNIISIGLIYGFPFLIINLVLPILSEGQKTVKVTQELNSVKANENVFLALLKEQPHYEVNKQTSRILLGDPSSKNMLTILTNPHCEPCARMHTRIEKLLDEVGNKFCVQYILSSFDESLELSNEFFLYINNSKTAKERDKIYHEWFSGAKYQKEVFFKKHNFVFNGMSEEYKRHKIWKENAKLAATPTLIFNGIELPSDYFQNIEYLKYFVDVYIKESI